jgi:hypothetical protein
LRNKKSICSNGDYYIDDKDYQTSCGGNTKSRYPLLSKLEYLIEEDMKLKKYNPSLPLDVKNYWKGYL